MKYYAKKAGKFVLLFLGIVCFFMLILEGSSNISSASQSENNKKTMVQKSYAGIIKEKESSKDIIRRSITNTVNNGQIQGGSARGSVSGKKLVLNLKKSISKQTNKNITLVVSTNNKKLSMMKWAKGKRNSTYFKTKGKKVSLKGRKASVKISSNGIYSIYGKDKSGRASVKVIKITNIDKTAPKVVLRQKQNGSKTRVTIKLGESINNIQKVLYCKGTVKNSNSSKWKTQSVRVNNKKYFDVASIKGTYTVMVIDKAGNKTIRTIAIGEKEMRAVWISFLEFGNAQICNMTESQYKSYINTMFNQIVKLNMNTVIVQVRPYADAMYASSYFPTSKYAVGKEGKKLAYDPLKYMVEAAHNYNLEIHAWINPYRITTTTTKVTSLSTKNKARVWRESDNKSLNRNVLTFDGGLFYNPAKKDVRNLIVNGVKEIVKNYNVDGIHFDDYFYPALGENYKKNFDYKEYSTYKTAREKNKQSVMGIIEWRRNNVDTLIKEVYKAVKSIDKKVEFGISPAGSMENLYTKDRYYCDVKKWMKEDGYVDYICPQIYWSFQQSYSPFAKTLLEWTSVTKSPNVDLYIGIAAYRAGITKAEAKTMNDFGWVNKTTELKDQVTYARQTGKVDGFMFYRYENLISSKAKKEISHLKSILQ